MSPDGRYLAYLRAAARPDERPRTTLVLARADGQEARSIVPPAPAAGVIDAVGAARWSPDSRHLVFTVTSGPPGTASAPGWRTVLERALGITGVAAHGNHADLWIVGADGAGLRQLTSKELDAAQAAWSPDGRRLAYTSDDGIVVRDLASGEERRLPAQDGQAGGLAWAPR